MRDAPEPQPFFLRMSDFSIQNKYTFKVLNKTSKDLSVNVVAEGGVKGQVLLGAETPQVVTHGRASSFTIFVKAPAENIEKEVTNIEFYVISTEDANVKAEYNTKFTGPAR
jgi:polyferredoxin